MNVDEYYAREEAEEARLNALTSWDDSEPDPTHWVYRYWNDDFDPGHQLMYVGFTGSFGARDAIHWSTSWWRPMATRIDMDPYPDRRSARAGEALTIKTEVPLYNIHKNPNCEAVHGEWKREFERQLAERTQLAPSVIHGLLRRKRAS
jgi:hypothetical protein